ATEFATISGGGRFVAFQSIASNLVPGVTNGVRQIFVRDRVESQTFCASLSTSGEQANGDCSFATVTPDGRFVLFESFASNLSATDSNGFADVFLRDTQMRTTELVSASPTGAAGNRP